MVWTSSMEASYNADEEKSLNASWWPAEETMEAEENVDGSSKVRFEKVQPNLSEDLAQHRLEWRNKTHAAGPT